MKHDGLAQLYARLSEDAKQSSSSLWHCAPAKLSWPVNDMSLAAAVTAGTLCIDEPGARA